MYDKSTVLIVLGSLLKNPNLFLDNKYDISERDFVERFHTIVFAAIKNLFLSGVQSISALEIDTYLSQYPMQKKIFDDNDGIQYIDNLIKFAKLENFDFHYNILKKYTLLRELKAEGIDTTPFIDESVVDPRKYEQMMNKFNSLSVKDILDQVERKFVAVKDKFYRTEEEGEQNIGEGLNDLVESLKLTPEIGLPTNGNIFNTISRGLRRKKFYLDSRPSGSYKSRTLLGNCAKISIPYFYDIEKSKWINTGFQEPTLFITTELEIEEIQTMVIAYVSGVNESNILDGNYIEDQEERVKQAVKYIEQSNMHIIHLPNYSIQDLHRTIKKYRLLYDVGYVFFDYIFVTPRLLAEGAQLSNGVRVREDSVLLNLATALKDMCNELDVHLSTSTQVSDGWQNSKHPDSSLIRACKGLADKVDLASIGLPPSNEELELLQPILSRNMFPTPNICYHIYKVRRGSYNKIRLYAYFDAGTCRTTELFATNNKCEYLEITGTNIEKILDNTKTEIEEEPEDPVDMDNTSNIADEVPW